VTYAKWSAAAEFEAVCALAAICSASCGSSFMASGRLGIDEALDGSGTGASWENSVEEISHKHLVITLSVARPAM
jgi:hypothetical protein